MEQKQTPKCACPRRRYSQQPKACTHHERPRINNAARTERTSPAGTGNDAPIHATARVTLETPCSVKGGDAKDQAGHDSLSATRPAGNPRRPPSGLRKMV